ncbi:MAG TPA: trypsin-like peptidase domain-containing protein [Mycobacteriales bacterium]|jgi:putative serine protease PepD|nr:trypsin-like peptidase domain-containing protein [Mycobacteriales bacterium]
MTQGFGRPDDTGETDLQWRPAPVAYPDDPYTQPVAPPEPPLPSDLAGWQPTEELWSPYSGRPRRRLGTGGTIAAAAVVAALVGGAVGAGGAWYAVRRSERTAVRDVSASLGAGVATPRDDAAPGSVAAIARNVVPSVVSIDVTTASGGGTGSGVILRRDGYVVTNNHVVGDAESITVTLADGTVAPATLVGTDPDTDLAVVKARVTGLPVATLGRSNALQVGDPVVAIGSPLGLKGTVTSGIISALNRSLDVPADSGGRPVVLVNAIQTDAAINPGNSGGALVDRAGRVIGINSAIASLGSALGGPSGSIGVGFAIPIDEARAVAEEIIRTGRATHPYLGISGNDLTPQTAQRFGLATQQGALVMQVTPGGPAERAGLRERDIIVRLGGTTITSMGDLIGAIRAHRIGEAVEVTFVRNGEQRSVRATLQQKPAG